MRRVRINVVVIILPFMSHSFRETVLSPVPILITLGFGHGE